MEEELLLIEGPEPMQEAENRAKTESLDLVRVVQASGLIVSQKEEKNE